MHSLRCVQFYSTPTCLSEVDGKQLEFILEILNGQSQVSSAAVAAVKRPRDDA